MTLSAMEQGSRTDQTEDDPAHTEGYKYHFIINHRPLKFQPSHYFGSTVVEHCTYIYAVHTGIALMSHARVM